MDSKIKTNDIKIIKASFLKVNKSSIVYTVDTRTVRVQAIRTKTVYARIDSVRCFSGQKMA